MCSRTTIFYKRQFRGMDKFMKLRKSTTIFTNNLWKFAHSAFPLAPICIRCFPFPFANCVFLFCRRHFLSRTTAGRWCDTTPTKKTENYPRNHRSTFYTEIKCTRSISAAPISGPAIKGNLVFFAASFCGMWCVFDIGSVALNREVQMEFSLFFLPPQLRQIFRLLSAQRRCRRNDAGKVCNEIFCRPFSPLNGVKKGSICAAKCPLIIPARACGSTRVSLDYQTEKKIFPSSDFHAEKFETFGSFLRSRAGEMICLMQISTVLPLFFRTFFVFSRWYRVEYFSIKHIYSLQ